jgi:hypothetical protein
MMNAQAAALNLSEKDGCRHYPASAYSSRAVGNAAHALDGLHPIRQARDERTALGH